MKVRLAALAAIVCSSMLMAGGALAETIKVGVLKFGTVNWELNTIVKNGLAERHGVTLEVVPFAGEDASGIAFRAGEVDIIVADWLEVARMRGEGDDVSFAPYSSSTGALMVKADSPIKSLGDLKGVKIAVAGGPFDKSWLLLQGMAAKENGIDLVKENEIVYGAPPLVSEKLESGEFDAGLNFWHFNARLEAKGFRPIAGAQDASKALGTSGEVSTLGYVFHEKWANEHQDTVLGFITASRDAKALLKSSDEEWQRLHADGAIKDEGKALEMLRDRYRQGIPMRSPKAEEADAAKLFDVLKGIGGEKLVGKAEHLPAGTYWPALINAD